MSNFDKALAYVIQNEGGYTNDPDDAGGPTNWGITQEDLSNWRGYPVTADDVKNLSLSEAADIYHAKYWAPLGCDTMQSYPVAATIFDSGVLYGIHMGAVYAQLACNACGIQPALVVDGKLGPKSHAALDMVEPKSFMAAYQRLLVDRIDSIIAAHPQDEKFRHGWMNRVNRLGTLV